MRGYKSNLIFRAIRRAVGVPGRSTPVLLREDQDTCLNSILSVRLLPLSVYFCYTSLALVAEILRKGGGAFYAIPMDHFFHDARPPGVRCEVWKGSWLIRSCWYKLYGFVALSCFSSFLSGMLSVFKMTFPLTFL
jgi:hypothetical protein